MAFTMKKLPVVVDLEAGKEYWWCACGRSTSQPFCDGSHIGSGLAPRIFTAQRSERAWLCACKNTSTPPFCDGSHNKLKGKP